MLNLRYSTKKMQLLTTITYGTLRERAIAIDPQNRLAYHSRGDSKDSLGDYEGAIADHDRAAPFSPKSAREEHKSRLKQSRSEIAKYDREIFLQERSANAGSPQNSLAYYVHSLAYSGRGSAKASLRNYKGAIADYDYLRYATRTSNCDRSSKHLGLFFSWVCQT